MKIIKVFAIFALLLGNTFCAFTQIQHFLTKKKVNVNILGTITNYEKNPVSSIWVILKKNDDVIGKSLTGDDGKFSIEKLVPGSYTIYISKNQNVKKAIYKADIKISGKEFIMDYELPKNRGFLILRRN